MNPREHEDLQKIERQLKRIADYLKIIAYSRTNENPKVKEIINFEIPAAGEGEEKEINNAPE